MVARLLSSFGTKNASFAVRHRSEPQSPAETGNGLSTKRPVFVPRRSCDKSLTSEHETCRVQVPVMKILWDVMDSESARTEAAESQLGRVAAAVAAKHPRDAAVHAVSRTSSHLRRATHPCHPTALFGWRATVRVDSLARGPVPAQGACRLLELLAGSRTPSVAFSAARGVPAAFHSLHAFTDHPEAVSAACAALLSMSAPACRSPDASRAVATAMHTDPILQRLVDAVHSHLASPSVLVRIGLSVRRAPVM